MHDPTHNKGMLAYAVRCIFQQNLEGVGRTIVKCMDEVATCQLSLTAWDIFAFPAAEEEHWKEDCLSCYLGEVVNIGVRMPGI